MKMFYQLDDEKTTYGPKHVRIDIGDLQPHQRCVIHIWTSTSLVNLYPEAIGEILDVTADEYDRRPAKFPLPGYLLRQQEALGRTIVRWFAFAFIVATFAYSFNVWMHIPALPRS